MVFYINLPYYLTENDTKCLCINWDTVWVYFLGKPIGGDAGTDLGHFGTFVTWEMKIGQPGPD